MISPVICRASSEARKRAHMGHVLGGANLPKGDSGNQVSVAGGLGHIGVDDARCNGVDPHPTGRQIVRQADSKGRNTGFGGSIHWAIS